MMPAAKHGDPQMGIDIHMCVVPPSPSPVPLPTPHMSVVFDPFDYVPYLGATVTVCGMKRATAGTAGTAVHIPPGFPFAPKLPDKDDESFMGSSTVVVEGEPFTYLALPVLGCQVAGMMSPPRIKKKNKNMMLLPTTFNLAIPTNVFVGGPPTISLMGMAFKGLFAGLGKFARSGLFRRMRQSLFKNLNPGFLKCAILRAEPVNILTGEVSVEQEDFNLPGRIPIEWARSYTSGNQREGFCGRGWETPADGRLEIDEASGTVLMHYPFLGPLVFAQLPTSQGKDAAELELMDGALLVDYGDEFQVTTKQDRVYHFKKSLVASGVDGMREIPLSRVSDLCGNWLEFQRRGERLIGISESAGRRIKIDVENGRIVELALQVPEKEDLHTFVRYEYDKAGDLVAVRDALDQPYCFSYDTHRMISHTDRNGLTFYYEYDKSSEREWRVVHAWGDGGLYNYKFEYLDALNERKITNSLGYVSVVKLNDAGLPISEIDPLGGMTIFEYDNVGRTTAVIDQDQRRTEYEYDERGNQLKLTRPDGECVETEFDKNNRVVVTTDPNGARWRQEWDARGLLIKQITPLGGESEYEYDRLGQLIIFTNSLGACTKLSFDGLGNLASLKDALENDTCFEYDILGNVIGKLDPLDHKTQYQYDVKSRLRVVKLPSGSIIKYAYDAEDNLTHYTDENGEKTKLEYYGQGEIKCRIQPDGHSVKYHYDTEEQLVGVTNQRGETYRLKRDPLGRIIEEVDYWGQSRLYGYSHAGYLKKSTDPLGRVIYYENDPLGRIVKKLLQGVADPDDIETEIFEYDANGNLIACANTAIRVQRKFDGEGRLLEEHQGEACSVTNVYDLNGNRTSRTTAVNIDKFHYTNTVQYKFDVLDRAVDVEVAGHDTLQFERNSLGQVTKEALSKNVQRKYSYSQDGYLTAQQVTSRESSVFEQNYHYDCAGNLVERKDSVVGTDLYAYDPLGLLVLHTNPEGRVNQYLSDPAGDRLSTLVKQQSTDEPDQANWFREGKYDGQQFRFDRAGNLLERKCENDEIHFTWDAKHRLSESTSNGQTTHYQYDPLGRRVSKEMAGIASLFFWDGDALLGDLLASENELEVLPTSRLREWVYYPETFEPLVMIQNYGEVSGEIYLYHNDINGCPTRLLDKTGKVVWAAQYCAWGGIEKLLVDQVDNPIRLQGQFWDGESGLCYNRHRYYDTSIGGYISKDPLGLIVGENLYQYASDPFGWIDPLGLTCTPNPVRYGSTALSRAVIAARRRYRNFTAASTNWAAARIRRGGQEITIVRRNQPGGLHAEEKLFAQFRSGDEVLEIYTERAPCRNCRQNIGDILPHAETTYTVPYDSEGRTALQSMLDNLQG